MLNYTFIKLWPDQSYATKGSADNKKTRYQQNYNLQSEIHVITMGSQKK